MIISTRQTAYKVRHVRRDPRVWLCAFPDGFYGRWVQLEGTADIVELPEAMDGLIGYYRGISGEHPDWDDYRAAMERDQRLLLRISRRQGRARRQRLTPAPLSRSPGGTGSRRGTR